MQLILAPRLCLGPNGSGKHKGERKSVAEALTGRQMPIPKAVTEAGLDQEQSCILSAVSQLEATGEVSKFLSPSLQHTSFIKFCICRNQCYSDPIKNFNFIVPKNGGGGVARLGCKDIVL